MHPLHLAVGEGAADQLQLLVADDRELLGDAHHRAVKFADDPGSGGVGIGQQFGHETFEAAEVDQALEPLLQGGLADAAPVTGGLLLRLEHHQILNLAGGQGGGQGVEEAEGKIAAAIGEAAAAGLGEAPAVAGAARTLHSGARLHQPILFQAAQMAAHALHRHPKLTGQIGGRGLAVAQQAGEHRIAGGCGLALGSSLALGVGFGVRCGRGGGGAGGFLAGPPQRGCG